MLRTCSSVKYTTHAIAPQGLQAHSDSANGLIKHLVKFIFLCVVVLEFHSYRFFVSLFDELLVCTALKTVVFGKSFGVALVERLIVE